MTCCAERRCVTIGLAVLGLVAIGARLASAQTAAVPPAPAAAAAPSRVVTDATAREAALEGRLREMEERLRQMPDAAHVRQLEATVKKLSNQVDDLTGRLKSASAPASASAAGTGTPRTGPDVPAWARAAGGTDANASSEVGFAGSAAGFGPAAETPSSRFDMPALASSMATAAKWGQGFQLITQDEEFDIQFHNLTQLDGRFYGIANQKPVSDTFDIARQWFVFNGRLTKPYQYYVSFNNSFDTFSALDVFLNVNYDKRFQFRFGRFKSPFCYEFYAQPTEALASGEWSVFFNNFGMNRDVGTMFWGESLAGRIDYAAGIFNSTPNGQFDLSNPKSLIAFLNMAPWRQAQGSPLENLNMGGSVVAGDQDHAPVPQVLRTIVPTSGSNVIGVPFLTFNNNVVATGPRNLWSLHTAYFYRSLMILSEWQSGFQDYAQTTGSAGRVRLPVESFYVQASYFLTGETMASRGRVKPRQSFDLRPGRRGPGAWEVFERVADLDIGPQVFTAGLADPTLWTNRAILNDLGFNWYWNAYIRMMFDWQHAWFGSPVVYRPGGRSSVSDLFMLRFQVWF